jgi:hypothetical protein
MNSFNSVSALKVVSCPYYPMQAGNVKVNKVTGIFVVLYAECDDDNVLIPQNVVALKVTTSRPYTSMFVQVDNSTKLTLNGGSSEFTFRKESYILASHLNTLPASNCTVLGELSIQDSTKVLSMVSTFYSKVVGQSCNGLVKKALN